ncbi:MAG: tripartite tricarboxylate transporter substrate-binding protein [Paracoccaceae bacterium]|nr:tripartite tricarboxylate transporter substrate-binding protein [Paracoccaceae bacterium]
MRRDFLKGIAASAALALGPGTAALAQDAAEFYKDNVIQWIVPYNPGGGYDEYSRAIAPYLEKYTGARVDIVNLPGAGGMKGANEIFNAPADGLTIGIINGSAMVTSQLSEIEGATYKIGEYSYLGRIVADLRVLVVGIQTPYMTFEDMQNASEEIVVGATGLGGSTYVDAVITGPAFGLRQKMVHGFDNSTDVRQAMLRGDVHAMWGSLGSAIQGVTDGDHRIVVQSDRVRSPLVPDVPSIFEFIEGRENAAEIGPIMDAWDALNAVGRPAAGPPGIPEDRLAFLRDAFRQALEDPEFAQMMTDAERELAYLPGEEMLKVAKAATELTPEVKDVIVKAIRGEI